MSGWLSRLLAGVRGGAGREVMLPSGERARLLRAMAIGDAESGGGAVEYVARRPAMDGALEAEAAAVLGATGLPAWTRRAFVQARAAGMPPLVPRRLTSPRSSRGAIDRVGGPGRGPDQVGGLLASSL